MASLRDRDVVITGVDGFVGRHVAELAAAGGARVHGVSRGDSVDSGLRAVLTSYEGADLREQWPCDVAPDVVIHLAGLSAVGPSFTAPQRYLNDNSSMVTTMCEALLSRGANPRIIGVSSGAVYAAPTDGAEPMDEDSPTADTSPYVVSKLLVEHQLGYYAARGLSAIVARPFNHIGPGQGPGFLLPDLFARLTSLQPGMPLRTGDLSTARDFTDVRDVARAYLALAGLPSPAHSVYNVASGTATTGFQLLERLCEQLGRPVPALMVEEHLVRPSDPPVITGSARRLRAESGWKPIIDLDRSVADFVAAAGS